jgi:hypothetical protein
MMLHVVTVHEIKYLDNIRMDLGEAGCKDVNSIVMALNTNKRQAIMTICRGTSETNNSIGFLDCFKVPKNVLVSLN